MSEFGNDGYIWKHVPNPPEHPFTAICAVRHRLSIEVEEHLGTGTVIGPRALVTAAHVVRGAAKTAQAFTGFFSLLPSDLFVIRAKNGNSEIERTPILNILVPKVDAVPGGIYDLAVLITKKPFATSYPALEYRTHSIGFGQRQEMCVAGYPRLPNEPQASGDQIRLGLGMGFVDPAQAVRFNYEIDTYGGHSGGPIFAPADGVRYGKFVGIHLADGKGGPNVGLAFSEKRRSWIEQLVARYSKTGV